jgi:hypothetical protein
MYAATKTYGLFLLAGAGFAAATGLGAPTAPPTPKPVDPSPTAPETPPTAEPPAQAQADAPRVRPRIQMALVLDTSNSMDGLIEQAKAQLWRITNELSTAVLRGQDPQLEVALYEYGKQDLPSKTGFIRQLVPFTEELDRVSEQLFALTTHGGSEHAGEAISRAVEELAWDDAQSTLRMVFIAGNESFHQGPIAPRTALAAARSRGIIVNPVFCGSESSRVARGWKQGARIAGGRFMTIDHNETVVHRSTPHDAELARLGAELNDTYIPLGNRGVQGLSRQRAQDANARAMGGGAMASRVASKASKFYSNPSWDLADAVEKGAVDLDELESKALPKEMQKMKPAERKAHVKRNRERRDELRARIRALKTKREAYLERTRQSESEGDASLGEALVETIRDQARDKGYSFR